MSPQYFNQVMESLHQVSKVLDGTLSDHEMTAKEINDRFRAHKAKLAQEDLQKRRRAAGAIPIDSFPTFNGSNSFQGD